MTVSPLTVTTLKGATVTIGEYGDVEVNGKPHSSESSLIHDSKLGPVIQLWGPNKAQVRPEDVPAIKAHYAAIKAARDERAAQYLNSAAGRSDQLTARMSGRYSDL